MFNAKKTKIALVSGLFLLASGQALADSDTTNFKVTVTITPTCDIHSTAIADVAFGSVSSTATGVTAQSSLAVNCTPGTSYKIALGDGLNVASGQRNMSNGTQTVAYNLYSDQAHGQVWNSANPVSGAGTGSAQTLQIYAVMPSANVAAGNYSDTVSATVTY